MADEKKSPDDEEEYQFSDIESTNVFGTQEADFTGENQGNPMLRNLLIAVGAIAVIFTVYKLMGLYFTPKQKTTTKTSKATVTKVAPVKKQEAPKKAVQMTQIEPPSAPAPAAPKMDSQTVEKLKSDLAVMVRQQNMDNRAELDRVNSSVATIRNELIEMNSTIESLKQTIEDLNQKIAKLRTPPKPKTVKKRRKRVRSAIPAPRRTHYIIQAMIPGRAWIKGKNGSTLTISVGSRVPGYGIVREIDAQKGLVITHTGATIKYPPEAR